MSDLGKMSDAIRQAGDRGEQERRHHSETLESLTPLAVIEPEPPETVGSVHYFQIGEDVVAYRKTANGFEKYPQVRLPVKLVLELAAAIGA